MKKCIFILISILASAYSLSANNSTYDSRSRKAERFFNNQEWASASAMYTLMLDEHPDSVSVWGKAIVAAGMQNNPQNQIELFNKALKAAIPLDSLFNAVRFTSFSIMQTNLYEHFLITLKEKEPWMERVVNNRLLDYYLFRDNGPGIVELSCIMLDRLPDNERFLYTLAKGQLLCGDIDSAIKTYSEISRLHPESLDALLYLGNYYASVPSQHEKAIAYLSRAQNIQSSPYLKQKIKHLELLQKR